MKTMNDNASVIIGELLMMRYHDALLIRNEAPGSLNRGKLINTFQQI
jgi:hypothetical protein